MGDPGQFQSEEATPKGAPRVAPAVPDSKLRPPAWTQGRVPRSRLIGRLAAAEALRLISVTGPAGSGKTISLAQHFEAQRERKAPVAWISLDRADTDAAVLLTGLIHALEVTLGAGPDAVVVDALACVDVEPILAVRRLLDWPALAKRQPWLIVDGYEAIGASPGARLLDAWIRVGACRLIVVGRTTPDLPLSLMNARGEVDEIGPRDLAFDAAELEALAEGRLAPPYLEKLLRETEGTPIVSCHAMRSLNEPITHKPSLTAQSWKHALQVYYREQIRSDLSADLWRILCRLSMVETFDIPLASAINGAPAGDLVQELFRVHGLVEQDAKTRLYQLPKGLRAALAPELDWLEADESRRIHSTAASWFAGRGLGYHAATHALAANDHRMAADYMGRVGSAAFTARFGLKDLRAGLEHLTEPELALQPTLSQARALALVQEAPGLVGGAAMIGGRGQDAEAIILDAFLMAYADVRPDPLIVEQCRGFAEAEDALDIACRGLARCFLCWESLRTARLDEARLWADISQTDFDAVDAAYGAVFVHLHAAAIAFQANTLDRGRAHLAQAEQIIKLFFPDDERLFNLVWLSGAWIDHDLGVLIPPDDLAACVDYVRDHEGWLDTLWTSAVLASRQALRRGDDRRALDFLEKGLAASVTRNAPRLTWALRCERVRLLTLVGDLDAAGREAEALGLADTNRDPLDTEPLTWVEVTTGWLTAGRLAAHAGQMDEALRLADAVTAFAERHAVPRLSAAALVLKAAAARPHGEAAALALIEEAHALFEGSPSVALFNDEAVVTGVTAQAALPVRLPSLSPAAAASRLTQREMELMALVAQGLLNKQIAYELGVTETTIKFHMRNIYRKLGAQNRVQALMRMGASSGTQ